MFEKISNSIFVQIKTAYKIDFKNENIKNELNRSKIIAGYLSLLELIIIIYTLVVYRDKVFHSREIYYFSLYIFLFLVMAVFFFAFRILDNKKEKYQIILPAMSFLFITSILVWNICITMLDQQQNPQVLSYLIPIFAIPIVSVSSPVVIISSYLVSQTIFMLLLPHFQSSSNIILADDFNLIIAIILCCLITFLNYRSRIMNFNSRMEIYEKNIELNKLYSELNAYKDELEIRAQIDGLTGIYNRQTFNSFFSNKFQDEERKQNHIIATVMIDIDDFKKYNDTYGHISGDKCLQQVACVINESVTPFSGFVARYGGEEFVLILPVTEQSETFKIAENIRNKVESLSIPHMSSHVVNHVTISIGTFTGTINETASPDEFLANADKALYAAKSSGRNCVKAYTVSSEHDL